MDASRNLYTQWEQNITRRFLLRIAGAEYVAVAGMHDHIDRERQAATRATIEAGAPPVKTTLAS